MDNGSARRPQLPFFILRFRFPDDHFTVIHTPSSTVSLPQKADLFELFRSFMPDFECRQSRKTHAHQSKNSVPDTKHKGYDTQYKKRQPSYFAIFGNC